MKEFLFVFRNDYKAMAANTSPEVMQGMMKKWMDWMGSIAAQNKLANPGNRLSNEGKVLRPNGVITDGPYTEIKELIGGYIVVKADSYEEAVELAKGCPILEVEGNVEIRDIVPM